MFALSLVFLSCMKSSADVTVTYLLNNKWILSHIQDTKTQIVTYYPADATKRISIVFDDSPHVVSLSGVCNNGSGTYTYSPFTGEIKVTDLGTTLIWCKYVEWETYTVQSLYYASRYDIDGNDLVIYSDGAYNLYFTRI
jgi:heat shock protein HslJ